jgi:hypothetical protein
VLEREPVAQIAASRDDVGDQRALAVGFDQRSDQIELIEGDQLENFIAHFALRIAGQGIDDLQMLWAAAAEKIAELAIISATLDERVETGARAAVGKATIATSRTPGWVRSRAAIAGASLTKRMPRPSRSVTLSPRVIA